MAGVTAQGGTFTFAITGGSPVSAIVTSLAVETPQAELVDMTAINAPADTVTLVPTGQWTGGSVTVGYIHADGGLDVQTIVRKYGLLTFASAGFSVSRNVVLESATAEASTGDIVRGSMKFRLTDYTG